MTDRELPHNDDAERAVLGAVMIDRDCLPDVLQVVTAGDFFHQRHARIFAAMTVLADRGVGLDPVTIGAELSSDDVVEYLADLLAMVATSAHAVYHARLIQDCAMRRDMILAADMARAEALEGGPAAGEILDRHQQRLQSLSDVRRRSDAGTMRQAAGGALRLLEAAAEAGGGFTGVSTGFADLDALTGGLQRSDLVILAGRPSMGKTSLALDMARSASRTGAVLIFSLEMSREQLAMRSIASATRVPLHRLRRGRLQPSEWVAVGRAVKAMNEVPVHIDDTSVLSAGEMKARARSLTRRHPLALVVVDYLQLMADHTRRGEGRQQEITEISRGLKALAKDLDVPVLALSQLSRAVEARVEHKPMLSDLRESGAIEQDADIVMFVYREEVYSPQKLEVRNLATVIVGKQRNGPVGEVDLYFHKDQVRFYDLERG